MNHPGDAAVRAYLLGLLSDAEAEELEDAYFGDPEVLARVRAAETDLLDDHAAGRLGPLEKGAFESRSGDLPALRARLRAARALRLATAPAAAGIPVRGRAVRFVPVAAAAALLLATLATLTWRRTHPEALPPGPPSSVMQVGRSTPSPEPPPSAPSPRIVHPALGSSPPHGVDALAFALSPALLRGGGAGTTEISLPPASEVVTFILRGEPAAGPLRAELATVEGAAVWSGEAERSSARGQAATVRVRASHLVPGDYLLTLTTGGRTVQRYFFRILRS